MVPRMSGGLWERFRRGGGKFLVALIVTFALEAVCLAQQAPPPIVPDGNTQTNLTTSGNVTNITTSTISGDNAYNSFSIFNVNQNNVVNLFLPGGTVNLLNLVNSQAMNVDGILNSIKDGKIGGNVFFADPYGVFIGSTGVVNVGSFTALTPTQDFMNQFFISPGNPSAAGTTAILNGTVPVSPGGLISVKGTINAIGNIGLYGGAVTNAGIIQSGAVFSSSSPDFSDVVNTNGLQTGTSIAVQNGNIVIQAAGDFENSGSIATNGASNLNAGDINIQAGGNINLDSGSLISSSGKGENSNGGNISIMGDGNGELSSGAVVAASGGDVSGNGGMIDFSAQGTVNLDGGLLKAGAVNGIAGTVTLDPTDLTISANEEPNDGTNLDFSADDSITVDPGVIISSRQIGAGSDALNGSSTGDSGDISFEAPQITVGDGAEILANATGTYNPGDISMTAESSDEESAAVANAGITIGNATIEGDNISLTATSDAKADNTVDSFVQTTLNDLNLGFAVTGPAAADTASSTSTITVGNPGSAGNATLSASGNVSIDSEANSDVKADIVGAPQGVAYGQSNASATATIGSNATITAGGSFDLSAKTNDNLELLSRTGGTTPLNVAVSFGEANSTSNAEVAGQVTAGDINIETENDNKFATEAKGFNNTGGGSAAGGIGVALGFYKSSANTSVPGSLTATDGDVNISSSSTNDVNATRSESEVTDKTDLGKIENQTVPFLGTLSGFIQSHSKTKPESNSNEFGLAAAVSYMSSSNEASSNVSGSVTADSGAVNIDGTAEDNPKISAAGSSDGANLSVGGGVAIGNFSNEADATVTGSANITAANDVEVNADAEIPNPISTGFEELAKGFDFTGIDFSNPLNIANSDGTGWGQALWNDIQTLYNGVKGVQKDVINPGEFFTSFTNTGLSAEGSGTVGLAGSVDLTSVTNQADAHIAGTAQVTSSTGDVDVNATSNATIINVAGMAFSLDSVLDLNPGVSGGSSLGGSYAGITLNNSSKAYIGDNTKVTATDGSVNVASDTKSFVLDVVQSGDKAEKFGITGAFDWLNVNDTSEAYIQSDATVSAGKDVSVDATNNLNDFLVDGALGMGGTVQVGVTVGWNQINQTTLAYIGDPSNSRTSICAGCGVTAGGDVNVNANSKENVYTISLAATKSGSSGEGADGESSSQPEGETAPSKDESGGGQYGFGVSGNIAFNQVNDGSGGPGVTTDAFINNGASVNAAGDINLTAQDTSFVVAVGVAATLGQSLALAGAYSQNTFIKQVEAYTQNSTLAANGLNLNATTHGGLFDISAGGGINTEEGITLAGSVNNNSLTNTTEAYVGDNTSAPSLGSGGVTVNAGENDRVVSVAGGISIASKGVGIGAGIDIGNYTNNVDAYVGDANIGSTGNIQITASTSENLLPIGVSLAGGSEGLMASGSLAYETLNNDTEAYIGDNATVSTPDNILIGSDDTLTLLEIAGDIGGSGNLAIGASADVNNFKRKSKAYIGKNAKVTAGGNGTAPSFNSQSDKGLALFALSNASLKTFAAGGAGAGDAGIAGSAVVNLLTDTTDAYIDQGAEINPDNSQAASAQDVNLLASDTTDITSLAGGIGLGGDAGIGAGADVADVKKDTEAWIGESAQVNARNNVEVQAVSSEDFGSMAAALSAGGSAGIAGAASVYIINDKTLANVDSLASVFSDGNVLVSAQDLTDLDQISGNVALGGSAGVGASASVDDIKKDTEAHIQTGATVTALGLAPAIQADTGEFTYSYVPNHGFGEVPSLGISVKADPDPALGGQQVATPATTSVTGVAVTAVSNTATQRLTVAGSAAGSLAASLSGSVDLENLTTTASIDSGANVNTASDSGAGGSQSVLVAAGSNVFHMGLLGGLALSASLGVGPSADISLIKNNTTAAIGDSADVQAQGDIGVNANGAEDFLSAAVGAAGSLDVSVAGGVSVVSLDDTTKATIGSDATADAGGNILVAANDLTSTDLLDGALAIGLSVGGVSGSVGVTLINKDTEASVGSGAQVNAKGNSPDQLSLLNGDAIHGLGVEANSAENLFNGTAGGAGGFYGGIAGDVTVENVQSTTKAHVDSGAQINQSNSGASSAQAVEVLAQGGTTITAYSLAGALGALGGAGAVNVSTVDNSVSSYIGDSADVNALGDISVIGNSAVNGKDGEISGALGAIGIAGSVSVWNINSGIGSDGQSNTSGVSSYASGAGTTSLVTGTLSSGDSDQQQAVSDVNNSSLSTSTSSAFNTAPAVPPGTSAFVGSNANVSAGGNLILQANNNLNLDVTDGSGAVGLASVGGAVGIVNIGSETQAYAGSDSTLDAGGSLSIEANLNEPNVSIKTYDGVANIIGAGVSYAKVSDSAATKAYVGSGAQAKSKGDLNVEATANRTDSGKTKAYPFGAVAAGASLSTVGLGGTTEAYIDGATATSTAGGINVEASSTDNSTATSDGIGGALASGVGTHPKVTDNTNTSAYATGGAVLSSSGDTTIEAQAKRTATANSGADSFGAIAVGAALADVSMGGTTEAYVDGGSVTSTAGGINVLANLTDNSTATADGLGGALASGVGTNPQVTDNANTYAYATGGAKLSSSRGTIVEAQATRNATANSGSKSYGAVSVGESLAAVSIGGQTEAYLDGGVQVGSLAAPSGALVVVANERDTGTATATPLAGGVGAGIGGKTRDNISPTVSAYDNGATVNVSGVMKVIASDFSTLNSTVVGKLFGAVTVGSVDAEGSASPTVSAYVNGGTANAGIIGINVGGIQSMAVDGTSSASKPVSFVSGLSITATGTLSPTFSASVGGGAILTAANGITVEANSLNRLGYFDEGYYNTPLGTFTFGWAVPGVKADATEGNSVGSGGSAKATATINNNNSVTIGSATLTSTNGNLLVEASSDNFGAADGYTYGGNGGVNVDKSTGTANLTDATTTTLQSGATLQALSGKLDVGAKSGDFASSTAQTPNGLSGVGTAHATANTTVGGSVTTDVDSGATVEGLTTNIYSDLGLSGIASASASVSSVLGDGAYATSNLDATGKPTVEVFGGATVEGINSLTLDAEASSAPTWYFGLSGLFSIQFPGLTSVADTSAKAGIVPVANSTSTNNSTLTALVQTDKGSTLVTNNLQVNSLVPSQDEYSNSADATWTSYALTGLKCAATLGFDCSPVTGTGTEHTYGSADFTNTINLNSTLEQTGSALADLTINPDGSYTGGLAVQGEDGSNIVLQPISGSQALPNIKLNAPGGTVEGNVTANPNIGIVNNSDLNLVLQGILLGSSSSAPNINVNAAHDDLTATISSLGLTIDNNTGSDVIFGGDILDPTGSLTVNNVGGDILNLSGVQLTFNSINFDAPHGSIGTFGTVDCSGKGCPSAAVNGVMTAGPFNLNLVTVPTTVNGVATDPPGQISAVARGDIDLNLTPTIYLDAAPGSGYSITADLNNLLSGGGINLTLNPGEAIWDTGTANGTTAVAGAFEIPSGDWVGAGGPVTIDMAGNSSAVPSLNIDGALTSGFQKIGFTVNADGSLSSTVSAGGNSSTDLINYAQSVGSSVVLSNINASQTGITVSGTGNLSGSGELAALNGASNIGISNLSSLPLETQNIEDAQTYAPVTISLTGNVGIAPGTYSGSPGAISVLSIPSVDLEGLLDSPTGTTTITSLSGDITGPASQLLIESNNINLLAAGMIGPNLGIAMTDPLGILNASAGDSIGLTSLEGDMGVGTIFSAAGDVALTTDSGSILNANPSGGVNVTGNNVTLTSAGSIGVSGNRLVVDNRNPDTITNGMPDGSNYLDMTAQGDIYVEERGGNLLSHSVSSAEGNIDLLASGGNGYLNQVIGNQDVTANVAGSLLDINDITGSAATAQKMASPNNVSLTVGTAGGTLNVNHMDVFQSVTTRADNTTLADVVHTNLANPQLDTDVQADGLHFDDKGASGGVANNIDINVTPCAQCTTTPAVIFDDYWTQNGKVTASVDWLEFINTIVGTGAVFQNNWLNIQLTNKYAGKSSSKADTPWYMFMIGDKMADSADPVELKYRSFLNPRNHPDYAQPVGKIFGDLLTSYGLRP